MSIHIQSFVEAHKTRHFSGKKKAAPCLRLLDKLEFVYLFLTKRVIPLTSIDIITHTHSTGDIVGITSNKVPQDSLATLLAPSL